MKKQKVIPILFDTYIAVIKNSVGSKMFCNFYAEVNGKRTDIMKNGDLSCAWFVSSLLYLFKLIKKPHATIDSTVKDLEQSGWHKIKKPRQGCVIEWEPKLINGSINKHLGFYLGKNKAISNRIEKGFPIIHHWTYGTKNGKPIRKIVNMFWNPSLLKLRRTSKK